MSRPREPEPTAGQVSSAPADEGVDPALLALGRPSRRRRHVALFVLAALFALSLGLVLTLRRDVAYYFSRPEVQDLGEARDLDPNVLTSNTFVRIHGQPLASRALRVSRPFGPERVVFPLEGERRLRVQAPGAGAPDAPREFSGRLLRLGELRGQARLRRSLRELGETAPPESYLLLADEPPESYAWALWLASLALLTLLVDLVFLLRWFRPLRVDLPGSPLLKEGEVAFDQQISEEEELERA